MQIYIVGALKWTEIYQLPSKWLSIPDHGRFNLGYYTEVKFHVSGRLKHGKENRYRNFETNSEPMSQ